MKLEDEIRQYLQWYEYGERKEETLVEGFEKIVLNHYAAMETLRTELCAVAGPCGETLISIFEKHTEPETEHFLINEAISTILRGADYSACQTMDDFKNTYAEFVYKDHIRRFGLPGWNIEPDPDKLNDGSPVE